MLDFALKSPRNIHEDTELSSPTPNLVRSLLEESADTFVADSAAIAQTLFQAQTANSPSGILIVATVQDAAHPSLVVLKAEHQEGMRLQRNEHDGHFGLEHLNELIVGNNSRVYKIALLRIEGDLVFGQMVDQQNGVAFADFFMSKFLGCRLSDNSELQTKQFMDSAMSFVNTGGLDDEKRTPGNSAKTYSRTPNNVVNTSASGQGHTGIERTWTEAAP